MPRWAIQGTITVSVFTEVSAPTIEIAREWALQRGVQGLCHQCSSGKEDQEWSLSGELDGDPEIIEGEELLIPDEKPKRTTGR